MQLFLTPLALALSLLSIGHAPAPPPEGIVYAKTLDKAKSLAKENGLPVLAYFTYEGCDNCMQMEQGVLPHPLVQAQGAAGFNWVKIDREQNPGYQKTFNVRDYPSFLVIGPGDENVHRWRGAMRVPMFLEELKVARERWTLFLEGKDWLAGDAPIPILSDEAEVRELPAPNDQLPSGMAFHDGLLYVVQRSTLYRIDPDSGRVVKSTPIAPGIVDITSDGEFLYGLEYGWTAGRPIRMLDPQSGKQVHEIVTEEHSGRKGYSALGIAAIDGALVVAAHSGWLHLVEVETGIVLDKVRTSLNSIRGLGTDGRVLLAASDLGLATFELKSGRFERTGFVRTHHPLRSVTYGRGEMFVMGQPSFGFGKRHERVRTWPTEMRIFGLMPTVPIVTEPSNADAKAKAEAKARAGAAK